MSTPTAPSFFGPYRLSSRLATGGMAEVYVGRRLGEDGRTGPMVAVKRLLPHFVKDPSVVKMFLNEARITAQIHHDNVVRIVDLGTVEGEPYIAMELLEGHSFAELREQAARRAERVPLGVTLKVLADACRGLDAAHNAVDADGRRLCIVHRDFTPDNIHVGVGGEVKVIDFGVAKSASWGAGTEPGTLKGKFFYMSPEMIAGREVDHRADLFAAGVMLYEQLCGHRPFTGNNANEVVARISEGRPRPPSDFSPSVPPTLEAICLRTLSTEPDARFASLREFVAAIEAVGGAAKVAPQAEVGNYLRSLFPEDHDTKRLALRRARLADPSLPDAPLPASLPLPAPETSPLPRPVHTAPALPVVPWHQRAGVRWAVGVTGALLLLGGGLRVALPSLTHPHPTPAVQLAQAAAAHEAHSRIRALQGFEETTGASVEEWTKAVSLLLEVQALPSASELVQAFVQQHPTSPRAHLAEAQVALALRQGKRAEAALERAQKRATSSPDIDVEVEVNLLWADYRELQGDASGAIQALGEALNKRPHTRSLLARRGYLLSQAGRLDEAESTLRELLRDRFDPTAAAELAFVLYRQDAQSEALGLLRRALKAEPTLASAHYYLGGVLFRLGDAKGAESSYREADRLMKNDARPLLALCELFIQQRKDAKASEIRALLRTRFGDAQASLLRNCNP